MPAAIVNSILSARDILKSNQEAGDLNHYKASLSIALGLSTAVDITLLSLPPGTRTIPIAHSDHDTFLYFLSGRGKLWYHGETYEMGESDCVGFRAGTGIAHALLNEDEPDPDGNEPCPLEVLVFCEGGKRDAVYRPLGSTAEIGVAWSDPPPQPLGPHDGRPLKPRGSVLDSVVAEPSSANPPVNAYWPPDIFHSLVMAIPNGASPPDGHEIGYLSVLCGLSTRLSVSQVVLPPGSRSSSPYAHSKEDEFYYIVAGRGLLWKDGDLTDVNAGQCFGFAAGTGVSHCMINNSNTKDDLMFLIFCQDIDDDELVYPLGGAKERQLVMNAARTWWETAPKRQFGSREPLPAS